jgi:hypothetical protein
MNMKIKAIISSASFVALCLAGPVNAATFTFGGNSNGTVGNSVGPSGSSGVGATTVTATGFAFYGSSSGTATVVSRAVGQYSGGLGVNAGSTYVGSYWNPTYIDPTSNPQHTIDNNNNGNGSYISVDMILFTFNQSVTFTSLSLGYVSGDSDFRYWVGGAGSTAASLFGTGGTGSATNGGVGGTDVSGGSSPADYTIGGTGMYLLVAARPGMTNDYFKIDGISFTTGGNIPGTPDAGSTVALLGLALAGLGFAKRRLGA